MDEQLTLTVYFEDPYWVGVWERVSGGQLRVCRVVFGAEPTDAQILQWVLTHWRDLRFSPAVAHTVRPGPGNPKRAQREAHRAAHGSGIGTKAQQALQAQREQTKTERRQTARARRVEETARRFAQKQRKRLEKHRGH